MLPPWHLVEVQSRASYEGSDRRRSFSLLSCPESLVLCFNTHFKYIFLHVFSSVDFWFGEDNAHFVIFLCAVTLFLHVFFCCCKNRIYPLRKHFRGHWSKMIATVIHLIRHWESLGNEFLKTFKDQHHILSALKGLRNGVVWVRISYFWAQY